MVGYALMKQKRQSCLSMNMRQMEGSQWYKASQERAKVEIDKQEENKDLV